MASVNSKISFVNKTTAEWASETAVPIKGSPCVEWLTDGKVKMKIGDGVNTYAGLEYVGGELTKAEIVKILGYTPAALDDNGKVPAEQLPSFVDDVIEGYLYEGKFYKEAEHTTEITAETGKIYVDVATDISYRWGGTKYVEIINSSIVTASEINGNIKINGTETTVYDDTEVREALDNKIDATETLILNCIL